MPRSKNQTTPANTNVCKLQPARRPHRSPTPSSTPTGLATASNTSRPPRNAPVELPRLLTVDEVADLLRISRKAVYTRIHRGAIPGVIRISRRVLIDGGTLVEWLSKRRTVSLTTQGDQR